jgi:addiction module RelB/DinJ family antitoxin
MAAVSYTIRLDESDKAGAEQVFNQLGLTLAAGINVYIKAVNRQQKIPFALELASGTGREKLQKALEAMQAQSVIHGTDAMTMDEIDALRRRKAPAVRLECDDKGNLVVDKEKHPEIYDWLVNG